jgi:DNA repair protein RadC
MNNAERDFPSQRLLESGWEALSEVELLTLFLDSENVSGTEANRSARCLMARLNTHISPRNLSFADLQKAGLSRKNAISLLAGIELLRKWNRRVLMPFDSFHTRREVFDYFSPLVKGKKTECFWNLLLDGIYEY